jgi:hypothetical protein
LNEARKRRRRIVVSGQRSCFNILYIGYCSW